MFTANEMLTLLNAKPFVPFRLHLSDGGTITVPSRELVSVGRRMAIVGLLDPNQNDTIFDRWTTVAYMHVTRVDQLTPSTMPFGAPPPNGSDVPSPAAG